MDEIKSVLYTEGSRPVEREKQVSMRKQKTNYLCNEGRRRGDGNSWTEAGRCGPQGSGGKAGHWR